MNSWRCGLQVPTHQAVQLMKYLQTGHELAALVGLKPSGGLVNFLIELAEIRVRDAKGSDYGCR